MNKNFWRNKKVLITGAHGFIGRNLVGFMDGFECALFTPTKAELDLICQRVSLDYFEEHDIDVVIHLAGIVGGIAANNTRLGEFFYQNAMIGVNALHYSYVSGVKKLTNILSNLDAKAKQYGISFILETDLTPERNAALMEKMRGLSVGLNFDMGNSAYWGFDPDHELPLIGIWIKNVHVKDCTPQDYTIPLGDGDVDFRKVFTNLKNQNYDGLFILQAAPAPPGKEKEIAKKYFQFTQNQLGNYYYDS